MVALLSAEGSVSLHDNTGTIEMRPDEKLDMQILQGFLASKLPNAEGQLQLRQFATGAANLTYLLRYHNAEFVLRRPPLGSVAPGSHDMQREYTILNNLYQEFPLAPRVYFFYADDDIIGAPFFVMERRAGYVINDTLPRCIAASHSKKTELAWMMIDTLAELHRIDPDKVSLGHLGNQMVSHSVSSMVGSNDGEMQKGKLMLVPTKLSHCWRNRSRILSVFHYCIMILN